MLTLALALFLQLRVLVVSEVNIDHAWPTLWALRKVRNRVFFTHCLNIFGRSLFIPKRVQVLRRCSHFFLSIFGRLVSIFGQSPSPPIKRSGERSGHPNEYPLLEGEPCQFSLQENAVEQEQAAIARTS